MAVFYNQATLSYNNGVTNSNIVSGELLEVLSATKTAVNSSYGYGDVITYIISIVNTGTLPYTGVNITDDLGTYTFGSQQLYPLTYVNGSVKYYQNGILQATPTAASVPPLTISNITVPANGNVLIVYETTVNQYAPLNTDSTITNTAVISSDTISSPITVTSTVNAGSEAELSISKAICPASIVENGVVTYTFIIENSGNTPAVETDNVIVTDTFNPILSTLNVSFNNESWTEGTDYTYDTATGAFATVAGHITVPAATFTQDAESGLTIVSPGVAILKISGTV